MSKINGALQLARGQWKHIFTALGIQTGEGKHCPCPACEGKDRFRFDDLEGRGTYFCNQCGAGDGLSLVQKYFDCDVKEATNKVIQCLGLNSNLGFDTINHSSIPHGTESNRRLSPVSEKVNQLLSKCRSGQSEYLTKKGLTFNLPLFDDGRIIVPVVNVHNEYLGAHFIAPDGRKKLMQGTDKKGNFILVKSNGSALSASCEIIICEGLATGITLLLLGTKATLVAAIDAGNLVPVAKAIREMNPSAKIIVAGDNDIGISKNIGQEKAIEAARAVNGFCTLPDTDFKCDWDDYRQQYGIKKTKYSFNKNLIKPDAKKNSNGVKLSQMAASQRAELLNEHYHFNLALSMPAKEIYHYQDHYWQVIDEEILKRSLTEMFVKAGEPFNPIKINSAVESLRLTLPLMDKPSRDLICFKNGVYDLLTNQFREHNKNDWLIASNEIIYYQVKKEESFETHAPNFYKWLTSVTANNESKQTNVLAALYMVLANRYDWQLFIELTGPGGSGKSVFAEICTLLAGKQNTVNGTMESLEKARERAMLTGKSLIILPDQPKYMGAGTGLKAITGGDDVAVDPKHKQPYSTKIKGVVLIINNEAMKFNERNGGISRRRVIFHFGEIIPEAERDLELVQKIETELPTIVRLLLKAFSDPLRGKVMLHRQQQSEEAVEIKRESDHLVAFCSYLNALDYPNGMLIGNLGISPFSPLKYLYHAYHEYVRNTGLTNPLSLTQFGLSLPCAMKENGKRYLKIRIAKGMKTNIVINVEKSQDWLSKLNFELIK